MRYEVEIEKLKKKVKELENTIEEKMEENYTLNEKVEELVSFYPVSVFYYFINAY